MAAVMPLVAHHRLTERFLRVDLAGDASAAGFACAIHTVRRCRGTWRTRNLLIDLRKVRPSAANVPAILGESLLSELPDVRRIACLQDTDTDQRHQQFGPSIRFCIDEAEALQWVTSTEPLLTGVDRRSDQLGRSSTAAARLTRFLLHPASWLAG